MTNNDITVLRQELVNSANVLFQDDTQRSDLLDPSKTQDNLVKALWYLTRADFVMITAVKTDHSDDSDLGTHCHFNGYCVDLWPVYISDTLHKWSYYPPTGLTPFLQRMASTPYVVEIGLAGSAYIQANITAAQHGRVLDVFHDDGADHIHMGVQ